MKGNTLYWSVGKPGAGAQLRAVEISWDVGVKSACFNIRTYFILTSQLTKAIKHLIHPGSSCSSVFIIKNAVRLKQQQGVRMKSVQADLF